MSVAQKLVAWLDAKPESWIDAQDGLGEIYAEAQVEAAQPSVQADEVPHCTCKAGTGGHASWCELEKYWTALRR